MGEVVTLTIEDPDTALSPDYTDSEVVGDDAQANFDYFNGNQISFDFKPGHLVTLTAGDVSLTHEVLDIEVTKVDFDANSVEGYGLPNSELFVDINACGEYISVMTNGDGSWIAYPICDLETVDWLFADQYDTPNTRTSFFWQMPPTIFPLDDFNRADGRIGGNWSGNKSKYRILDNQLRVRSNDSNSDIYWKEAFGPDQEAFFTFTQINETATEQDLLLKAQSNQTWGDGVIEVLYDAPGHTVQVWTWEWPQGWVKYGDDIPVTFMVGDAFKARARPDGIVEIYRNGELLGTRDVTTWSHYAEGGYIGLWFIGAKNTMIDDFGGGAVP